MEIEVNEHITKNSIEQLCSDQCETFAMTAGHWTRSKPFQVWSIERMQPLMDCDVANCLYTYGIYELVQRSVTERFRPQEGDRSVTRLMNTELALITIKEHVVLDRVGLYSDDVS
jgi:hypothetical protein